MIPTTEMFVQHVAGHAGVPDARAAEAARIVLSGLGAHLAPGPRQLIADELPPALGAAVLEDRGVALPIDEALLGPHTTAAQAHELIASVCRVLAEELSTEALARLRAALPPGLATLFAPSAEPAEPPPHAPEPRRSATLASARPGSRHPLSEAQPRTGQVDSVGADNPHGDSKVSSAHSEDLSRGELAAGHPGSARAVSSSRS